MMIMGAGRLDGRRADTMEGLILTRMEGGSRPARPTHDKQPTPQCSPGR
jgi:hypothetical protein